MILPDYAGGSIANLMRSLGDACGAAPAPPCPPLRQNVFEPADTARHVVLLVIDGLGDNYLRAHGAGGALLRHRAGRLTSVFPSTTATAVTTFLTGLAPQQHALTGWHMYFSELDAILAVLPLRPRGGQALAGQAAALPARLFGHPSFFQRIGRPGVCVSPQAIADSPFNRYHAEGAEIRAYRSLAEMFGQIIDALRMSARPAYVHAYYPELDALAHAHGIGSAQVAACFAELDAAFAAFLAELSGIGALVLACADHGFIDSPPERQIDLAQHPELQAMLARPLCGEHRAAYCYLRPGQSERFAECVREQLGGRAELRAGAALVAEGWFGSGAADPRLASRVGDAVLVMRENWTLFDWLEGERRHRMIGVHGGLSADEMLVPLVVARAG
ncbi:MAG TPA: alkaline phosphatase family protein [Candidatus Desulfobacillus sp.]|nr:alkaline phosphatase family protein [Candidatus Desulfobacillus sp.]